MSHIGNDFIQDLHNDEIEKFESIIKAKNDHIQDLEFELYQLDIVIDRIKSTMKQLKSDIENGE
jgi:peptidoglycan hydrolase CwlO-like protein